MTRILFFILFCIGGLTAQIKPTIGLIGGDDVPVVKTRIAAALETVLLQMNRARTDTNAIGALKPFFDAAAFTVFTNYVAQNKPVTARKIYEPQMIERQKGQAYDIRSIMVKVDVGDTEAGTVQNIVFTFSRECVITSVRIMMPNYDYQSVIARGETPQDSVMRGRILDFMEQFRMAYNAKNIPFLEKVYSDDALILVGTVLKEKPQVDDMMKRTLFGPDKVKLIQQTKREYLDGLRERTFKRNSSISVRFEKFEILRHEKIPYLYGVSCFQQWKSSTYADKGFLFLMMDFKNPDEPVIHVRTWQPKPFDDNGQYVKLSDFEVVESKLE